MTDHETHQAFRDYLRDELLRRRPDFTTEGAEELADIAAASVPDNPAQRQAFLNAYWDAMAEEAKA